MNNNPICIIGAMESEVKKLKAMFSSFKEVSYGIFTFYEGILHSKNVVIVKSGVGKVCAAVCTQILIDKFNPQFIVNTGIAGGLSSDMAIGDVVIADKLVQHDFDTTAIGYAKGYVCNGENSNEPTFFYADKNLKDLLIKSISKKLPNLKYHEGIIASGDVFIGRNETKKEIHNTFKAIAVEMEGAAIAHACVLNKIPFIVIRAISDLADEKTAKEHVFNENKMANTAAETIEALLESV